MAFATDPQGSLDVVKNVTHFNDIFTSNRPFIGIGELGFDVATAVVPGGAGVKAAGGARAAEGAAARTEISATERAAGEAGGIASATTGLRGVTRDLEGVTNKLDDLNKTTLDGGKPPSGSPGPLPKTSEPGPPPVTRDPAPAPPGGKPTSAPPSSDHVPPPVTHTPHAEPAPTGEGAPGRVPDAAEAPAAPAGSAGRPPVSDPIGEAPAASAAGSPGGSGLPSVPSAGSMGGEAAHAPGGLPAALGGAGDRMPAAVEAHGAEGAADGVGHGPHPGAGDGGGGSHGDGAPHGGDHPHEEGSATHDGGNSASPNSVPQPLPPDSPLFDGYVPHDPGPEFTDADGNLIYPDDTDPAKPYAVPGSVVPHVDLPRGTLMDRFGYAGGAWLSPDGTPFPFRGLPNDSALKPYFQYVVDDPTKLPPGWSIEQSEVAPWFHQPGGGVQYRIIAPEGQRPSVQTLLEWGYLKEVHE